MHILLTNDDGYRAPGLVALHAMLCRLGRVTVVAPERNQSGASQSLTLTQPLHIESMKPDWFVVSGTPSDCVHAALSGLLTEKPDLVVSGINGGCNLGEDTLYSGTVAAAIEGFLFGIPSFAFSQTQRGWAHLDVAVHWAEKILTQFVNSHPAPREAALFNVNIPMIEEVKEPVVTRLGRRAAPAPLMREMSPRGFPICWLGMAGGPATLDPDTDFGAIERGHISLTPLQVDLTHFDKLKTTQAWLTGI